MRKLFCLLGILISVNGLSQNLEKKQTLESYIFKNQYDSAIVVAKDILSNDSVNWEAYYYLGKSYQSKYKYFDAIDAFEKANEIDSANSVIENSLAESYDFIGREEDAIQIYYDQYLRDTNKLEPNVRLANTFRKNREYTAAIHYYQKAIAIDPQNFYYFKQLGYCFDQINIADAAIFAYNSALMYNPYDISVYTQLANLYNGKRSFSQAIDICNSGLKLNNENAQLLKIKAYAHYLNRDFDSSIVVFGKLLEMGDSSYFNLKYQGLAYFEKQDFEQSIYNLKLGYKDVKDDAELCFFIGSALGRTGNNQEGMLFLNRAIGILAPSPNEMANIYSEMANIYLNMEKYEASLEYLKLAYKSNATPLLSFRMGQLYDYYLKNRKLAINCYDAYLTMANEPDSTVADKSFFLDPLVIENARERIRILKEEEFFESAKEE